MERYVLLPPKPSKRRGPRQGAAVLASLAGAVSTRPPLVVSLRQLLGADRPRLRGVGPPPDGAIRVIDSVAETGPKLLETTPGVAATLAHSTGLRVVRERLYDWAGEPAPLHAPPGAAAVARVRLTVRRADTGAAVAGASVTAFTRVADGEGAAATTDAAGVALLPLGTAASIEKLVVQAPGCWTYAAAQVAIDPAPSATLYPVDPAVPDCVRSAHGPPSGGQGVKVAVIDTGVNDHPDLQVAGGHNTVTGEADSAFGDAGPGHGHHVAGTIAGKRVGVAPGAAIRSYRVFPQGGGPATNYAIMKAMWMASWEGCDILNLSLFGSDSVDEVLAEAVQDCIEHGAVAICAAGNDGRKGVVSPARLEGAVAVTAFGMASALPPGAAEALKLGQPAGGGQAFATFSNWGPQVGFCGPGVGVVSHAVDGGYEVRSGTSMATAAVSGMAARLLAADAAILGATRDAARGRAIQNLLGSKATTLGFPLDRQGAGRL